MPFAAPESSQASLGLAPLIDVVCLLRVLYIVTPSLTESRLPLERAGAQSGAVSEVSEWVVATDGKPAPATGSTCSTRPGDRGYLALASR